MNTGDSSGHFTGSNRQYICHHVYHLTSELRSCGLRPMGSFTLVDMNLATAPLRETIRFRLAQATDPKD